MTVHSLTVVRTPAAASAGRETRGAVELLSLGAHYAKCNGCKERWFSIRCALDAVDAFLAPRFVTTVFIIGAVVGVGALAL